MEHSRCLYLLGTFLQASPLPAYAGGAGTSRWMLKIYCSGEQVLLRTLLSPCCSCLLAGQPGFACYSSLVACGLLCIMLYCMPSCGDGYVFYLSATRSAVSLVRAEFYSGLWTMPATFQGLLQQHTFTFAAAAFAPAHAPFAQHYAAAHAYLPPFCAAGWYCRRNARGNMRCAPARPPLRCAFALHRCQTARFLLNGRGLVAAHLRFVGT